jgi:hypothetical protein
MLYTLTGIVTALILVTSYGCIKKEPDWYFVTGDHINGPYPDSIECGWMAGRFEEASTGRKASACWTGLPR